MSRTGKVAWGRGGPTATLLAAAMLALVACNGSTRSVAPKAPGPATSAEGAAAGGTVTLALGGDTMLARMVTASMRERGPRHPWGDVLPLLRDADLALVNLECVIAEGGEPFEPRRVFYFRAAPVAVEALTLAGIDYVSLANNHAMDYGAGALLESLGRLDRAGIAHAGAGRDLEAARRFALLTAGELRVAVISAADHYDEYAAEPGEPGTNVIPVDERGLAIAREGIAAAREAGADLVVFSMHWGPNMNPTPRPGFPAFARAVLDAGADVFHGHSAHVFQGVEIHDGKPLLYDTGDLVDDYRIEPELRNDLQLLFLLEVDAEGTRAVELVPLHIDRMQVRRARGEEREWIERRIRELSRPMGTVVERAGERLRIRIRRR